MKPKTALSRSYKELRLERQPKPDGTVCWTVLDQTDSGNGVYGDEEAGRRHYEKCVMFRALAYIDAEYDWHEHDWHTLEGPAADSVAKMVEWRAEQAAAMAEVAGYRALAHLMVRGKK